VLPYGHPPFVPDCEGPAVEGLVLGDHVADLDGHSCPLADVTVDAIRDRVSFVLPAALVCAIESVVAEPRDPRVRAAAISAVVDEIYQSVAWVHGEDLGHAELTSLAQLLVAARAHEARIAIMDLGGVA
jgi:hypothetical protein